MRPASSSERLTSGLIGLGLRPAYHQFRADRCEACGFEPVHISQLDVHHVNGNHADNAPSNLETLCANCHRLRTWEESVRLAKERARQGLRHGGIPFGSRLGADGKTLETEPDEQATLASMRAMRAAGVSLRGIVSELEATGRSARGSRWHLTTVAKILAR